MCNIYLIENIQQLTSFLKKLKELFDNINKANKKDINNFINS